MSELKPCPFCDGDGKIIKLNQKGFKGDFKVFIRCTKCGLKTNTQYSLSHDSYLTRLERAINSWNSKLNPIADRLQQENERYKRDLAAMREDKSYPAVTTLERELIKENEQLREQLNKFEDLQTPKEANEYDCCPRCSTYLKDDNGVEGDYCPNCGQHIKWLNELGVEI